MPDSCQPYSAVDFNHTDCKKKVLLLGPRAHLVFMIVFSVVARCFANAFHQETSFPMAAQCSKDVPSASVAFGCYSGPNKRSPNQHMLEKKHQLKCFHYGNCHNFGRKTLRDLASCGFQ